MNTTDTSMERSFDLTQDIPRYILREKEFYEERVKKAWGGKHIMHGRTPDEDAVLLMSNDYLSIADCREILEAQSKALLEQGNGLLMSAIFLHGDNPQADLEQRMATFMSAESAVLCQSGWCANVGLLQSICDESTPVYVDIFSHMSLWEGVKSAGAQSHPFLHNNTGSLEQQIRRHGSGVIVVDSVYSVSGTICPLVDMVEIAEHYNCILVVDESHSLGTHGEHGEGLVSHYGLADRVQFRTASLAKAFAGRAGIVTCSSQFSCYFKSTSRPAIFSSALLPHEIVGLQKTLDIIIRSHDRRQRLQFNSNYLRSHLQELGYLGVAVSESQIIPLEAGPEWRTVLLKDALESRGVFGAVFCAPATAKNRSLIRMSVNAALEKRELDHIIDVCGQIRSEVELSSWPCVKKFSARKHRLKQV